MRASRSTSLLSKFGLLILVTLIVYVLTLFTGGVIGWYYKTTLYHAFSLANVNWPAALAAPFYMTLVTLPALTFTLLVTVVTRSSFAGIAIGLGFTQFIEILMTGLLYGFPFSKWIMRNLYFSATYLLNSIGNKTVDIPPHLFAPEPAFIIAAIYTLIFLAAALWLYRRQDVGG
jgi:hypothetical protein